MTAVLYSDREVVTQLLDLGRWVDKPDSNGLTPLMAATLARDADMVQLLLERGADPNLQAPGGEVALEMARSNGDGASESLLLKAGARY
jgi:ankyrin repeat protein